jgi:hypothetical protein
VERISCEAKKVTQLLPGDDFLETFHATFHTDQCFQLSDYSQRQASQVKREIYYFASASLAAIQVLALLFAFEKPAHAYVDPGSGLLAFQIAGSMIAGVVYYLRARIARLFSHSKSSDSVETPSQDAHPAGKQS